MDWWWVKNYGNVLSIRWLFDCLFVWLIVWLIWFEWVIFVLISFDLPDWVVLFWYDGTDWYWLLGCWVWSFIWHFDWGLWTRARAGADLAESPVFQRKCRSQCPACKNAVSVLSYLLLADCFMVSSVWKKSRGVLPSQSSDCCMEHVEQACSLTPVSWRLIGALSCKGSSSQSVVLLGGQCVRGSSEVV